MKRIEMCRKINRNNNTIFNHTNRRPFRVNSVSPEILVEQMWLQDQGRPAVEIIELNSSSGNVGTSPDEPPERNFSHAWSYINNDHFQQIEDDYKVNKKARERRRMKNENLQFEANKHFETKSYANNWTRNHIDIPRNNFHTNDTIFNPKNYFTDINEYLTNSETSSDSENYADIEFMAPVGDCGDMIAENHMWENHDHYAEKIISYNPEIDADKRTIRIYSFKNKRLLSDNDFVLSEIASRDPSSSTSCSFENMEEDPTYKERTNMSTSRVASPIPPIYVPRLDLSLGQTLSTVTEVTEPNKPPSSNETEGSVNVILSQKPINSWLASDIEGDGKLINKREKSTNVINWMALSPRERRRTYNNTNSDVIYNGQLYTVEASEAETKTDKTECPSAEFDKGMSQHSKVDVEVHISDNISIKKFVVTPKTIVMNESMVENINAEDTQPITKIFSSEMEIEAHDIDEDYLTNKSKPQIRLNTKLICNPSQISSPIEKLDSNNWIVEETDKRDKTEKQTATYDCESENIIEVDIDDERNNKVSVEQRLWAKNVMSLMKPAEWTEYLPITETSLSLNLSISSAYEKQSWFKRLIKFFNCFK